MDCTAVLQNCILYQPNRLAKRAITSQGKPIFIWRHEMKDENYITIQGWMRTQLNLKGNELMVYALIYGFSQDEESEFSGSANYIAEWIGASRQTVHNVLKGLCEKGLLHKREENKNGVKFCSYKALHPVKNFDRGVSKNLTGGCQKIRHNNIDNNTNNKNIDIYSDVPAEIKDVFMEWVAMRKSIKKPVSTKGTVTRAINKLNALAKTPEKQIELIQQSIDNCWQSFYPLKKNESKGKSNQYVPEPPKYKEFKPTERKESVRMPEEIRKSIQEIFT